VPSNLPRFSSELETAVFRVIQQSLANVHKHSGSKSARIRVLIADSKLVVEVSDEGHGIGAEVLSKFREGGQSPGIGISGMRERVIGLHGNFDLKSDDLGTAIVMSVPVMLRA